MCARNVKVSDLRTCGLWLWPRISYRSPFSLVFLFSDTSTKTLLIWMGVCSMIGSLSVMFTKGVGLAFTVTFGSGPNQFVNWATWMCVGGLILCVTVQMNFLNKVN